VTLLLGLLLLSCGDSDSDSSDSGGDETGAGIPSSDDVAEAAADRLVDAGGDAEMDLGDTNTGNMNTGGPGDSGRAITAQGVGVPALQPTELGRDLIFTARSEMVVDDVAGAGLEAQQTIASVGGFLFGQETVSEPHPRSTLVFKVPPDQFAEALRRLGELGSIVDQSVTTDDVTERLVDLGSQILSMEASVGRLRAFLEEAETVETVAVLERELLERETELEVLRGQQRTLRGQVDLATITLVVNQRVLEASLQLSQTIYVGHDDGAGCPGRPAVELDGSGPVTVCYVVVNDGDRTITELALVDEALNITTDDVRLVSGSRTLEPGMTATLVYDHAADETVIFAGSVRGVDSAGERVSDRAASLAVQVPEDDGVPGFGDSVGAGVDVLVTIASVTLMLVGFALPLLWIPAIVGLVVWRVVRQHRAAKVIEPDAVA